MVAGEVAGEVASEARADRAGQAARADGSGEVAGMADCARSEDSAGGGFGQLQCTALLLGFGKTLFRDSRRRD